MKIQKYISKLLDVFIAFVLLLFFASFGFRDGRTSGWYQQWFPNLNGSSITSMTFLDSLTGFAVTSTNSSVQGYIIKTTNGGDNWNIIYTYQPVASTIAFNKIQFANDSMGYASTNYYDFYKTINSGLNWTNLSHVPWGANDMSVINKDTILIVSNDIIGGGVYRTTNSGLSWQALGPVGGSGQPYSIYMFNKDMGFNLSSSAMKKTTNGGVNWFVIPGESYSGIQMLDSLIGWKCTDSIKKTTDGGLNWSSQKAPVYSNSFSTSSISINNRDTIWLVGARKFSHPPVYKTINGGTNWGYQVPDTTLQIYSFNYISFVTNKTGWAYPMQTNYEIHTKVGGDSTIIQSINNNNTIVPVEYVIYQNYPNPFNSKSNIKYQILKTAEIKIKIFNISGKEIKTLLNKQQNRGDYQITFDGENLSSGIYFYSLYANGVRIDTKKMVLLK
ncbi:MAG TPA: T9SS type A sorting domain-containing protein [Ignavibacteria bacterium]